LENAASAVLLAPDATYGTLLALVEHLGMHAFVNATGHKMMHLISDKRVSEMTGGYCFAVFPFAVVSFLHLSDSSLQEYEPL
jgi:prolyl-tRNA editing enzyme YbaK/EbsC (Cys-tRNA(Pro) deacylase)